MKSILISLLSIAALSTSHAQDPAKSADATPAAPPAAPAAPTTPAATPSVPAAPAGEVTKLMLGVLPAVMKFDKAALEVKAGAKVMLLFKNDKCPLQHNFLLVGPGKLNDIGALADKMLTDPQAMAKAYLVDSPDVLAKSTKLIGIGQTDLIEFTAPTTPGDYPYLCTFPGHWRMMQGVLKVVP